MNISIIGSFRKYYNEIKELILLFEKHNYRVLSPKFSEITHTVDDFVVFASDNSDLSPAQIQTETLNRILKSDLVYVFNPNGYIGRTTCYEIGVLRTTRIPIIFYERPIDLPITYLSNDIVKPEKLIHGNLAQTVNNNQINIDKNKVRGEMSPKNIVICGSMAFYDEMVTVSEYLKKSGIPFVIPKEENFEKETLTPEEFNNFKRRVSNQYLAKIRDSSTFAVLILNYEKKGHPNYIGANTLVEISMAFSWGRPIFIYNDYYEPLMDELLAWEAICLKGKLDILVKFYNESRYTLLDKVQLAVDVEGQLELGDIYEHFYPLP